jgi:hypothetical protein
MIGADETENRRDRFNTCSVRGTLGNGSQNLPTVESDYEQQNRKGKLRPKTRLILQPALKGLKQSHAADYRREDNDHELAEHNAFQGHAGKIAHSDHRRPEREKNQRNSTMDHRDPFTLARMAG